MALTLTTDERTELEQRVRSRTIRSEDARAARVILMLADGASYSSIEHALPVIATTSIAGVDGSGQASARAASAASFATATRADRRDGSADSAKTQQTPPDGSTHWSTRKLARAEDSITTTSPSVAPGRPAAAPIRAVHAVGRSGLRAQSGGCDRALLNPPQHAAVFAVDEKTAIQALDRLDPVLPLSPGAPSGTASSTTATARSRCLPRLNTTDGRSRRPDVPRHTSDAFRRLS
jgi:hypothetical protein